MLSWNVLSIGSKNKMNQFVFPLAIPIAKGVKLALAPLYSESLYTELDECIQNVNKAIRRYDGDEC